METSTSEKGQLVDSVFNFQNSALTTNLISRDSQGKYRC